MGSSSSSLGPPRSATSGGGRVLFSPGQQGAQGTATPRGGSTSPPADTWEPRRHSMPVGQYPPQQVVRPQRRVSLAQYSVKKNTERPMSTADFRGGNSQNWRADTHAFMQFVRFCEVKLQTTFCTLKTKCANRRLKTDPICRRTKVKMRRE